jgi:hypothetical protein
MQKETGFKKVMDLLMPGVEPKTDDQIYQEAYAEWVGVLSQLWAAIGKPVDPKQLAVYVKQLGDIPLGILERVVSSLLAKHIYHTVPTIGDIWWEMWLAMGHSGANIMNQTKKLDMDHLRWQLANWSPTPRVDKYAEVNV